jgi:hypothetical protein
LPGGHEKIAEELGTLEVFKLSKVARQLNRFLRVQQLFENILSLERRIFSKCENESRTCRSPKDSEIIHLCEGDKRQNIEKFGRGSFGRFAERKQGSSQSRKERFESRSLDLEEHMARIHAFHRKEEENILSKPK